MGMGYRASVTNFTTDFTAVVQNIITNSMHDWIGDTKYFRNL